MRMIKKEKKNPICAFIIIIFINIFISEVFNVIITHKMNSFVVLNIRKEIFNKWVM